MDADANWRHPWLVAAWPGLGAVAQIAATHLAVQLDAHAFESIHARHLDEARAVQVEDGIVRAAPVPRSVLHGWRDPHGCRDLLVALSDRQPATGLGRHAALLVERVARHGIERVVTFAAMGTPMHPSDAPRVFTTATTQALLDQALAAGAVRLDDGEILGMNGLVLAAAAERRLPALGLLGEMPFFAGNLPNPRAAAAVLDVLAKLLGVVIDTGPLQAEGERAEQLLLQHLPPGWPAARPLLAPPQPRTRPPSAVLRRVEALFVAAAQDRNRALELKAELDRHGLFAEYEDRFLDLFRQGS